jgi:RNA polymerase sigma-70 factor (ECF subfamily)
VSAVGESPSELALLLEGVAARDETSFTRLVTLLDFDLLRLAFVISGDAELAQDAVQATWERLWNRPPVLRDPERIRSWLLSVAGNEARRTSKRRRRGRALEREQASYPSLADPSLRADAYDLADAIRRLPAVDRELLGLRYVLGLSSPEIATHIHLSPEGIRTRLRRALGRLREDLSDER